MARKKSLFIVVLAVVCMIAAFTGYSQSYNSLLPLLVDLSGWKGENPEGMDLDYGGSKAITATREYEKGDKNLTAALIVGRQMQGSWNPAYQEGFKMETTEMSMVVESIKGFLVFHTFDKTSSDGLVMVLLQEASPDGSGGGIFTFAFEGVSSDEGMKLAQKFDWNRMKSAVSKL
jgi:hypothetical protein